MRVMLGDSLVQAIAPLSWEPWKTSGDVQKNNRFLADFLPLAKSSSWDSADYAIRSAKGEVGTADRATAVLENTPRPNRFV